MRFTTYAPYLLFGVLTVLAQPCPSQIWQEDGLSCEERRPLIDEHIRLTKLVIKKTKHCNDRQQILLGGGLYQGHRIINHVLDARKENSSGILTKDQLLGLEETYFGKLNKDQRDDVTNVFKVVSAKLDQVTWKCLGIDEELYNSWAYVKNSLLCQTQREPDDLTVFIGSYFTTRPYASSWWHMLSDLDTRRSIVEVSTRPRAMIHELMHLAACKAGAENLILPRFIDDYVYGRHQARLLANTSQELALTNADNYALYSIDLVYGKLNGPTSLDLGLPRSEDHAFFDKQVQKARRIDDLVAIEIERGLERDGCNRHDGFWECENVQTPREHNEL